MKKLNIFLLLIIFIFQVSSAQVPNTISYQGVLRNADGTIVSDGTYSLKFNLYESETEGTAVWSETRSVSVTDGIFNVILGDVTSLDISFDKQYWLGITVGGGSELTPRSELTSVPYSLNTKSIDDLSDGSTRGGFGNLFIGTSAGAAITTGRYNTASGYRALYSNTTGNYNTASGNNALRSNTEGRYNTASGNNALYSNKTGIGNTASGATTLAYNTTGNYNTASGNRALWSNTTGNYNTASGASALRSNTTGSNNTASGGQALFNNTTGYTNTASGFYAGQVITTGWKNVIIGAFSNPSNENAENQIVIGYGVTGLGNNYAVIGNGNIERLYVAQDGAGVLYANGTIQSSDERIKENINDMDYGLNFIKKLRPVTYKDKKPEDYPDELKEKFYPNGEVREMSDEEHDRMRSGFIAQEVLTAIQGLNLNSDLVTVDDDGFHRLDYTKMVVPLIKAVQELSAKVEELESRLNHLKGTDLANSK